jgi:glutamine amidotransferase
MPKDFSKNSIVIIDYGSGNIRSAAKAFERVIRDENLDMDVVVSNDPESLNRAARIVLPGQGAFGDCMNGLLSIPGMIESLNENVIARAKPFLGICVGMQLMAERGLEHGTHKGLGWINGDVVKIKPADARLKIPHMGWNEVQITAPDNFLLRSIENNEHFYFVHSFALELKDGAKDSHCILGTTDYGGKVAAIAGRDNMIGTQFHPEKSQKAGLKLIGSFLKWKP